MLKDAFYKAIEGAQRTDVWFLCLMEKVPYYGGPEEGGWWGDDVFCRAFKEFPTKELAERARDRVNKLAEELSDREVQVYGEYCNRQQDWLEDRMLDSDYLRENDGPASFYTTVTREIPEPYYGSRHYE